MIEMNASQLEAYIERNMVIEGSLDGALKWMQATNVISEYRQFSDEKLAKMLSVSSFAADSIFVHNQVVWQCSILNKRVWVRMAPPKYQK